MISSWSMPFQDRSVMSLVDMTLPRQTSSGCLHPVRAISVARASLRIVSVHSEKIIVATFSIVLGYEVSG